MNLEVVDYIKAHGLDKLCDKFEIAAKRHGKYNNLVLLKYDQINSPMGVKVVQQCRGLILDEAQGWKVVSFPYSKFFNYGEGHADDIDWSSARVYEKLDGSLMTLYFYDGAWQVSSSGLPDAAGEVNGYDITFSQLFWQVWKKLGYKLPTDTNVCYMFEMMTAKNRVVVRHLEDRIVLHGARRLSDFKELNPVIEAHHYGWECVKIFPLTSWDEIVEAAKTLEPMECEGYVVCDSNYNRVKVKSPQYVAVSHLRDSVGMSRRKLLELVRTNEGSEFLSYYPEFTDEYNNIRYKYERLLGRMEGFYDGIKHIEERKDFAKMATTQSFSDAMFQMKYGKTPDFKRYVADMQIKSLEEMIGLNEPEVELGEPREDNTGS